LAQAIAGLPWPEGVSGPLPGKRRDRYLLAEKVVDRVYMTMPVQRRQRVLRRLGRLTRQVSG
jgi:hypothetical protein